MRILKKIILYILMLIVFSIFGCIVIWLCNKLFNLGFNNEINAGVKVGFVSWIGMIVQDLYYYLKRKKKLK